VYRSDARLEVRDDWSGGPTLCNVLSFGGDGDPPTLQSRQARLCAMLSQLATAVDAVEAAHGSILATASELKLGSSST
jgi:hypothetical protein